jgi:uncharacterized protein
MRIQEARADETRAEAAEICDADPFHRRGLRTYRLVPWQINEGSLTVQLHFFDRSFSIA